MKSQLLEAVANYHRAAEEMENMALITKSDCRSKFSLVESRLIRGRILDAEIRAARAERYLFEVPVDSKPAVKK